MGPRKILILLRVRTRLAKLCCAGVSICPCLQHSIYRRGYAGFTQLPGPHKQLMEEKFGDRRCQLLVRIQGRRRTICAAELLEAVMGKERFGSTFPIMVLMAEEAAIL